MMTSAVRVSVCPGGGSQQAAVLNVEAQAAFLGAWPGPSEVNALVVAFAGPRIMGRWFMRRAAGCGYGSVRVGQQSDVLTATVLSPRLLGAPQLHPPTLG